MSRRRLEGIITSTKGNQTALVTIATQKRHPKYGKRFMRHTTHAAHNPDNRFELGDIVVIEEHRPISKTKRWLIREKIGQTDVSAPLADNPIESPVDDTSPEVVNPESGVRCPESGVRNPVSDI